MSNITRHPRYKHPVGSAMASSLLAVGLYTTTFEALVRLLRIAVLEYIQQGDSDKQRWIAQHAKAKTAAAAIAFCSRYLIETSTATKDDITFLHRVRRYRNQLVHEAIDRAFVGPSLADVSEDIRRMIDIAHAIEIWQRSFWPEPPEGYARLAIMFSGALDSCFSVARELVGDHIRAS